MNVNGIRTFNGDDSMIKIYAKETTVNLNTKDTDISLYIKSDLSEAGLIFQNKENKAIKKDANIDNHSVKILTSDIETISTIINKLQQLKNTIINNTQGLGYHFECAHCGDTFNIKDRIIDNANGDLCLECYKDLHYINEYSK